MHGRRAGLRRRRRCLQDRPAAHGAEAGDWATVKAEQDKLNELSHIFDCTDGVQGYGAGVGAFKTALQLMGVFESNQMLRPVKALSGANVEAIRNVLAECGLL